MRLNVTNKHLLPLKCLLVEQVMVKPRFWNGQFCAWESLFVIAKINKPSTYYYFQKNKKSGTVCKIGQVQSSEFYQELIDSYNLASVCVWWRRFSYTSEVFKWRRLTKTTEVTCLLFRVSCETYRHLVPGYTYYAGEYGRRF